MSSPNKISSPAAESTPLSGPDDSPTPEQRHTINGRTQLIFYLRLSIFIFIEGAFIILASVCLAKPLPLHTAFTPSNSDVKGGFTVIFIMWHTLAISVAGHILADAFSREWSVQLANIVPGATDRVSTVTSGILDRTLHIATKHASGTFKLAFLASLAFVILGLLAPATINAATILVNVPITVDVGRPVSQVTQGSAGQLLAVESHANLIVRLEMIERTTFGFMLPENTLVPLPSRLGDLNGPLEYDTDIVNFYHDCHWEAPSITNGTAPIISAAGQAWQTNLISGGQVSAGSSISPLSLSDFQATHTVGTSAYLFVGGNSTIRNNSTRPETNFAINLGDLPATFVTQGTGTTMSSNAPSIGSLASVLICNPQTSISSGHVRLFDNGTVAVVSFGQMPSGNFPLSAVNIILSNALQVALSKPEPLESANLVNNVASRMFIANTSIDWNNAQDIPPLDIPTLNKNVDAFLSSAAKAFIDGYRKDGPSAIPTFDSTSIPGTGSQERLALTASKGLFITTVVVDVITVSILYALCRSAMAQERYPFDLSSVLRVISEDQSRRSSLLKRT